jgi:hypothetical protein
VLPIDCLKNQDILAAKDKSMKILLKVFVMVLLFSVTLRAEISFPITTKIKGEVHNLKIIVRRSDGVDLKEVLIHDVKDETRLQMSVLNQDGTAVSDDVLEQIGYKFKIETKDPGHFAPYLGEGVSAVEINRFRYHEPWPPHHYYDQVSLSLWVKIGRYEVHHPVKLFDLKFVESLESNAPNN